MTAHVHALHTPATPAHRLMTLNNGLRVALLPMPETHSAYIGVFARAGSVYETPEENGISHFLEHMLLSTSKNHPSRVAFNLAIQSIGGEFSAWTHKEITKYSFRVHPAKFLQAGEILHECVTNEHWTEADVDAERKLIINELESDEDDAVFADLAAEVLWGDTCYARPIIGTRRTLKDVNREKLINHRRRAYGAKNLVLVLTGCYSEIDASRILKVFESLPSGGGMLEVPEGTRPPQGFRQNMDRDKWNYADSQISFEAFPWNHNNSVPARFLSFLLESSPSRLAVKLRWEVGFVYHYSALIEDYSRGGFLSLNFRTSRGRCEETLRMALEEIGHLRAEPPTEDEIRLARDQYRDFILFDLDSVEERGHRLGVEHCMSGNGDALSVEEELARIETITADEIHALARYIFRKERLAFIAMGRFGWLEFRRVRRLIEGWTER